MTSSRSLRTDTRSNGVHQTPDPQNLRPAEPGLLQALGAEEALRLTAVRSLRNRRELYHRLLIDARSVQAMYIASPLDPVQLESRVRESFRGFLEGDLPRVPIGIPTLVTINPAELGDAELADDPPFETILLDLRGQAPGRALAALAQAGNLHSANRLALGLAILTGAQVGVNMVDQTIQRWIRDYGRGEVFNPIKLPGGIVMAIDGRRVARHMERLSVSTPPLAVEIAALEQLLALAGSGPEGVAVRCPLATAKGLNSGDGDDEARRKRRKKRGRRGGGGAPLTDQRPEGPPAGRY